MRLGMRESNEDWLALGRDLIGRGLAAPMLIVADGAPGLIRAIEEFWPTSDRQRCCVHRARNLYAKLPELERERVKHAYWQALDDATNEATASNDYRCSSTTRHGGFTAAAQLPRRRSRRARRAPALPDSDTANGGDEPTCSSDRSARSNGARR